MTHDVTSWFIEQSESYASEPVRKFTLGSSDYSDYVIQWPTFRQTWNSIRPSTLSVKLANEEQAFNFMIDDLTVMSNEATLEMGYTHPTSGDELITLYSGKIERLKYHNNVASIAFVDKFKQLTERVIGTRSDPVTYQSSDYLPADIAWYVITSYGGYDTTASSANTDIDYESWLDWSNVFSADAVLVKSHFKGIKVAEALKKIADYTDSAIYVHDNKIRFKRFSLSDSNQTTFDNDSIMGLSLSVDNRDVVNKMYVSGLYDVDSRYWSMTVNDENSSSVNSFGLKEDTIRDNSIWYVNSGSAINMAQRKTGALGVPFGKVSVDATLKGLVRVIGETISVTDMSIGISEGYRIMGQKINMDSGKIEFEADRSYFSEGFILDTSTLDSVSVLT